MASPAEAEAVAEKRVMVVAIDDSEHSTYALEWTLDHFFTPYASNHPFKLVLVHAKPTASSAVGLAGPGKNSNFHLFHILFHQIPNKNDSKLYYIARNEFIDAEYYYYYYFFFGVSLVYLSELLLIVMDNF